jgi:hypothetical protein
MEYIMSFNKKKFIKAEFEPRQDKVPVPDLKEFFDEGTEPVWVVRGLSGHELGKVNEAHDRNKNIEAIMSALLSNQSAEKSKAIKELLGMDDKTPGDIVRRLSMIRLGSVDPEIDEELAVRLCTFFPVEFMLISQKISELTGQGAQVKKKPTNSGPARTSATP